MDSTEKLSVEVHNEFARRIEEHNDWQDQQIRELQENVKQIQTLTVAVERMAVSTEAMAKELGKQGARLDDIEKEPANNWKKFLWIIGAAIIGGVLVIVGQHIGIPL